MPDCYYIESGWLSSVCKSVVVSFGPEYVLNYTLLSPSCLCLYCRMGQRLCGYWMPVPLSSLSLFFQIQVAVNIGT